MKMKPLGRTGLMVSELCLGTMTWGTQTPESDAHRQMDTALDHGITFIDTAEMYPVNPVAKDTIGLTEQVIGNWQAANPSRRGEYLLATKHSGAGMEHVREGAPITSATIPDAVEGSLQRLKTDVIDLYQFHWPNRGSYMFRRNWGYDPSSQNRTDTVAHMEDTLEALQKQVDKGNIRYFGLSNETAWGTTQWLQVAEQRGWPRVVSIQNEYSLLCRLFDTDLSEMAVNEDVGLLAYSPLAAGMLSGKYQGSAVPDGSRRSRTPDLGGRITDRAFAAVTAYLELAAEYGLDPVHMALGWCAARPFMTSVIFGASTQAQLDHVLSGAGMTLPDEVSARIDEIHRAHPMPF